MGTLTVRPADRMSDVRPLRDPPEHGLTLRWLGQAGFVLEAAGRRLILDPYLSDSLAIKYRNGRFPHDRMMPPPLGIADLGRIDAVLSTHRHTDHMDPATLHPLLAAHPQAQFVAPRAEAREAVERSGRSLDRITLIDAGERNALFPGVTVTATVSAHESIEHDAAGCCRYLGYAVDVGGVVVWHSGDCVPFAGLAGAVRALAPDVVLLPVNGRRPELSANGVPGNFTLEEAVALADAVGASVMVAHHFGMFAFNTIDPARIDSMIVPASLTLLRAEAGRVLEWC